MKKVILLIFITLFFPLLCFGMAPKPICVDGFNPGGCQLEYSTGVSVSITGDINTDEGTAISIRGGSDNTLTSSGNINVVEDVFSSGVQLDNTSGNRVTINGDINIFGEGGGF